MEHSGPIERDSESHGMQSPRVYDPVRTDALELKANERCWHSQTTTDLARRMTLRDQTRCFPQDEAMTSLPDSHGMDAPVRYCRNSACPTRIGPDAGNR